jgi:nesprin-1
MLEDVLMHWKRWNALVSEFESWIVQAHNALQTSEDEKIYFFQNVSSMKEKFDSLTDTYNILKSTCDYDTASKIEKK